MGTVLVLTRRNDVTADLVIRELARRRVEVFRCDTSEFPTGMVLTGHLDAYGWRGGLRTSRRQLDFADIGAVYYRRPTRFGFPDGMPEEERRWAHAESLVGFGGVLGSVPALWVNHPHDLARAEYKPWQLVQARAVGLDVPAVLVTNDPVEAREFAESIPVGVVYKPFHGPPQTTPPVSLFTTQVTPQQCGDAAVAGTAHLFQEWVADKEFEVRLMVIADQVFAARIDAGSVAAKVDWRADASSLTYSRIEPPDEIRAASVALVARLGLTYGALDLAVSSDGRWRFFEINAAGQWGWIPPLRDPITRALADLLEKGNS